MPPDEVVLYSFPLLAWSRAAMGSSPPVHPSWMQKLCRTVKVKVWAGRAMTNAAHKMSIADARFIEGLLSRQATPPGKKKHYPAEAAAAAS